MFTHDPPMRCGLAHYTTLCRFQENRTTYYLIMTMWFGQKVIQLIESKMKLNISILPFQGNICLLGQPFQKCILDNKYYLKTSPEVK